MAAALPLGAQTWFELDRTLPPAGQVSSDDAVLEVNLDSLKQAGTSQWINVMLSWTEPRRLEGLPEVRSVLALVEVSCPTQLVRWQEPRFFTDRQGQGQEVKPAPEQLRTLQASDWLPLSAQGKLVRGACGRLPFKNP